MSRPGFVLDIDRTSPPIFFWRGEQVTTERLPIGSRVAYAPDPQRELLDCDKAIATALDAPVDTEALKAQLRPGMRLTVAFDDVSQPVPPSTQPDARQRAIEAILELAVAAGVDDVEIIAAIGLRRRMYEHELRQILGDRIYDSFAHNGLLTQHNAQDRDNLTELGVTASGDKVELNRRVAESDLVIYVGITSPSTISAWRSFSYNLASVETARSASSPLFDKADRAAFDQQVGNLIEERLSVFQIALTLGSPTPPSMFSFLQRREREWTIQDKAAFEGAQVLSNYLPGRAIREISRRYKSSSSLTGVFAGRSNAVHTAAIEHVVNHASVAIEGQADIVSLGIPMTGPFNVKSIMNPVLMAHWALGRVVSAYRGKPAVREGGVVIIHHSTRAIFDPVQHPAYREFFETVLSDSTDPQEISKKAEDKFASDKWFSHLHLVGNAYHGVHPFHAWYECAEMLRYLNGVIVVGGDYDAVTKLGFRAASTFRDALEMAKDIANNSTPTLTHLHMPPTFVADVN